MARTLFIIPLLVAYLAMTCRVMMPLVSYWVNYDSYLERCENKAKPELECDGCCQVKKEVAKAAENHASESPNTPNSQRTQTQDSIEFFHLCAETLSLTAPESDTITHTPAFSPSLLFGVGAVPFQPPRS